jgi:NAD(P)-dependent dehydrogenase (short-subunit alcohol dehydrogenase family)
MSSRRGSEMPRAALVTGAASGQGACVAGTLAKDGFGVGLVDVDEAGLAETAALIEAGGGRALCLPADVARRDSVEEAVDALESALGPPWVVAAAAAVCELSLAMDATEDHWLRVTSVNYLGVVHTNTAAAASMIEAGRGGRIVNWSSISAQLAGVGGAAYVASKAALEAFSRSLAVELAPHKITVNVLRPGSIRTPMMWSFDEQAVAEEAARIPLGRWGEPRDVAAAARFLASEEAEWITGTVLTVDGGGVAGAGGASLEQARERIERERAA